MSMTTASSNSLHADPNVTPLIDVLLVLLIIFMVIMPVTPRGLEAVLPQQPKSSLPAPPQTVVVQILPGTAGPAYKVNELHMENKAALVSQLSRIYSSRAEKILFVQGDPALDFAAVADVIDLSRALGIDHVGILTPGLRAN